MKGRPLHPPAGTFALAVSLCASIAFAASTCCAADSPSGQTTSPSAVANQLLSEQFGPFTLAFGQDNSGGFGANLSGQGRTPLGRVDKGNEPEGGPSRNWIWAFRYLGYAATGSWGTSPSATNNASLSLKPGVDSLFAHGVFSDPSLHAALPISCDKYGICKDANGTNLGLAKYPDPYLGLGVSGDLELRYGTFKQNSINVTARELLLGAGAYLVVPRHWDSGFVRDLALPRISAGYYHPMTATGTTDVALPQGVKTNYLQTRFETVLGFGPAAKNWAKLDLTYEGSQATSGAAKSWQNLWTIKLWAPTLTFAGVNPSITYQSGAKGGFQYDRQVLLGVLVEFLDPKAK